MTLFTTISVKNDEYIPYVVEMIKNSITIFLILSYFIFFIIWLVWFHKSLKSAKKKKMYIYITYLVL